MTLLLTNRYRHFQHNLENKHVFVLLITLFPGIKVADIKKYRPCNSINLKCPNHGIFLLYNGILN